MIYQSENTTNSVVARVGELEAVLFETSHAEKLSQWLSRDAYELFLTSSSLPFPCSASTFEEFYRTHFKKGSHEFFSVFHSGTKRHVGHFEIKNISAAFRSGTLAHVLLGDRDYRGKGLGKNFVQLMSCVGFEILQLYRLGLAVHVDNCCAVSAYVRGGFLVEGIVRDVLERDGKRISLYQMGLLSPEWSSQNPKN